MTRGTMVIHAMTQLLLYPFLRIEIISLMVIVVELTIT